LIPSHCVHGSYSRQACVATIIQNPVIRWPEQGFCACVNWAFERDRQKSNWTRDGVRWG
jgi:hypothetical protein